MAKYKNVKCEYDGMKFDSQAEMRRYKILDTWQRCGHIKCLTLQRAYILAPAVRLNGRTKPALKYIADFTYCDSAGALIVEDVKGVITAVYRVKKHLMKSVHGIEISEIK
jgi:hypothetical protein